MKESLAPFDVYDYLKDTFFSNSSLPYLLVDEEVYIKANVEHPVRNTFFGIALTSTGSVSVKVATQEYTLTQKSIILLGRGLIAQWEIESDPPTDTILFREPALEQLTAADFLTSLPFFLPGGQHVLNLEDDEYKKLKKLFQVMNEFEDKPGILSGILHAMLVYIKRIYDKKLMDCHRTLSVKQKKIREFRSLVANHFREEKKVQYYASQLNVTPKYLSEFLKSETGKTAKTLINDAIYLEAKSLLKQTALNVQEISLKLGYTDASYFSKAFKKKEGISPLAYRSK